VQALHTDPSSQVTPTTTQRPGCATHSLHPPPAATPPRAAIHKKSKNEPNSSSPHGGNVPVAAERHSSATASYSSADDEHHMTSDECIYPSGAFLGTHQRPFCTHEHKHPRRYFGTAAPPTAVAGYPRTSVVFAVHASCSGILHPPHIESAIATPHRGARPAAARCSAIGVPAHGSAVAGVPRRGTPAAPQLGPSLVPGT